MSVQQRTHYEILEVLSTASDASDAVVRSAYRAECKELHPDRGGDPQEMAAANHAYAVLTDLTQRKAYDDEIRTAASSYPQQGGADPACNFDPSDSAAAHERDTSATDDNVPAASRIDPDDVPFIPLIGFLGGGALFLLLSLGWVFAVLVANLWHHASGSTALINAAVVVVVSVVAGVFAWKRITTVPGIGHAAYAAIGALGLITGHQIGGFVGWLIIAWATCYIVAGEFGRRLEKTCGWITLR